MQNWAGLRLRVSPLDPPLPFNHPFLAIECASVSAATFVVEQPRMPNHLLALWVEEEVLHHVSAASLGVWCGSYWSY